MKSLFIAFGVFAVGFAILTLTPGVDLIPSGVRAVFDEVETVW